MEVTNLSHYCLDSRVKFNSSDTFWDYQYWGLVVTPPIYCQNDSYVGDMGGDNKPTPNSTNHLEWFEYSKLIRWAMSSGNPKLELQLPFVCCNLVKNIISITPPVIPNP